MVISVKGGHSQLGRGKNKTGTVLGIFFFLILYRGELEKRGNWKMG